MCISLQMFAPSIPRCLLAPGLEVSIFSEYQFKRFLWLDTQRPRLHSAFWYVKFSPALDLTVTLLWSCYCLKYHLLKEVSSRPQTVKTSSHCLYHLTLLNRLGIVTTIRTLWKVLYVLNWFLVFGFCIFGFLRQGSSVASEPTLELAL